mgnify:FL=1
MAGNIKKNESYDAGRYTVRYGYDANAALQPEYIPYPQPQQPEREPERREAPRPRVLPPAKPQARPRRKQKAKARAMLVLGVVFTAVLAFAVVMRNSQIYQNNRSIQQIGAGISQATDELNAAKQRLSAMEDVEEYLNRADGELDMTFPGEGEYRVINITPAEEVGTEDNVLAGNGSIIDAVLDWLNSLERRT